MHRPKKLFTGLVLLLSALLLFSCRSRQDTLPPDEARENALREVNLYGWSAVGWAFPEKVSPCPAAPYVGEDGSVTLVLQRETYENNQFSVAALHIESALVTFSPEGERLREEPIPLGDKESVGYGVLTEDSFHFVATEWGQNYHSSLVRFDRKEGKIIKQVPFGDISRLSSRMQPFDMAEDAEGNVYLLNESRKRIETVSAEYGDCFAFLSEKLTISGLFLREDGHVWAAASDGEVLSLMKVNRETGGFTDMRTLHAKVTPGAPVIRAGDWLYFSAPDGIHRISLTGKNAEEERVLDYNYSGIYTLAGVDGWSKFLHVIDGETFLFSEKRAEEYGISRNIPQVYKKSAQLLTDAGSILQVAFACELPEIVRAQFVLFNRTHDDLRVVTLDYGGEGNGLNGDGGAWKMMTDIKTGLISPDIVIDRRGLEGETDSDSSPMKRMAESGMTVDLGKFLDSDPVVSRDNVFGCVLRTFSDRKGGIWGIAPYFGLRTWLSTPDLLDGYAADGSWTVAEYLDFLDGLPAGTVPYLWCCSDNWANGLLSDLASFYDTEKGSCRFDSAAFVQYLNALSSLPDMKTYERESPYAEIGPDDLALCYRDGTVRLRNVFLYDVSALFGLDSCFGTSDFTMVGYPSHQPSGARVETDLVFMISSGSPSPGNAWELIRYFFLDESLTRHSVREGSVSLPALKSSFDAQIDRYDAMTVLQYEDGGVAFLDDPGRADPGRAYREIKLDRDLVARVRAYLDAEGSPLLEETPDAVREIVSEELSAFLAGHGSAEDCAEKIQSRVSIWLAERR